MRARYILPNFRIAVVGAGAIGGYYGAKLGYFGRDVHFLMRGDLREVRRFGIRIKGKAENIRLAKVNAYATTEEIGPCDLVLIALKTTANQDLLDLIPPLLKEKTMLLTLQNGLGNEEFLAQHFGAERVLGGLCFVCLNRVSPGVIEHYDVGRLIIGEFNGHPAARTHDVSWEFKRCGVVCTVTANLMYDRWRKLVWNIPFNGLAITAGGIDTAQILGNEELYAVHARLDERSHRGGEQMWTSGAHDRSARTNQANKNARRLQAVDSDRLRSWQTTGDRSDLGRAAAPRKGGGSTNAAAGETLRRTKSIDRERRGALANK